MTQLRNFTQLVLPVSQPISIVFSLCKRGYWLIHPLTTGYNQGFQATCDTIVYQFIVLRTGFRTGAVRLFAGGYQWTVPIDAIVMDVTDKYLDSILNSIVFDNDSYLEMFIDNDTYY